MTVHHFDASAINRIKAEALASRAVHHPYLKALQQADLPNFDLAIKDFAFQYGIYSKQFTQYLQAVINNLNNNKHREMLLENLTEEQGDTHDVELPADVLATVTGIPHAQLYRRFQEAVGIDDVYRAETEESATATLWRNQFLQLCALDECVGVGAIGIGTELIVSSIYSQILEGLKAHSNLTMIERVFFDLHSHCDDEHAAQMLLIAKDLAVDDAACEKIEYGAKMALHMRTVFWDNMLARAQHFPATANKPVERLSIG